MSFTDKVVVITGAASGIGTAIAVRFAKLNASLCIVDKNETNLRKVKSEVNELTKKKVFDILADLRKDDDVVKKVVQSALNEFGKIDVLVNCAGIVGIGNLLDPNIVEQFDEVIAINLRALFVMTTQALPALIESKGCIVNISSIASSVIAENLTTYSISKAGVTRFTKSAAFELASRGVRVNCISPGYVKTNIMLNGGMSEEEERRHWEDIEQRNPMRKCAKAEEVAGLAVYLASDDAASITGSDFVVDAGLSLGRVDPVV